MGLRIYCQIPFGSEAELLRNEIKYRSLKKDDFEIVIEPPGNILGGFDLLVCPWEQLSDIRSSGLYDELPIIAYGPADTVMCSFRAGASDHMRLPWDLDELIARAKRLICSSMHCFSWGNILISDNTVMVNNVDLQLQDGVCQVFKLLLQQPGKILPRRALTHALGLRNEHSRIVDVYIAEIRKKLDLVVSIEAEKIVITHYRKGYSVLP